MFESELKQLFTRKEYNSFLEFMISHDYLWLGKEKNYCLVMYIQEFLYSAFKGLDNRLAEIIETCVEKYPQVLGLCRENI